MVQEEQRRWRADVRPGEEIRSSLSDFSVRGRIRLWRFGGWAWQKPYDCSCSGPYFVQARARPKHRHYFWRQPAIFGMPPHCPHIYMSFLVMFAEKLRVGPNDTYNTGLQIVIKFRHLFDRYLRSLNLHEYERRLGRKIIVHPAQNTPCSSNALGKHRRGCPTGVSLTRRHVSVPWEVKSVTNSSRYNAQRDKRLSHYCRRRARSVVRLGAVALSTRRRELGSSLRLLRSVMTCHHLGNDPAQSRALASGGTARAVPLPDSIHPCT